jgi:hypothetical protein
MKSRVLWVSAVALAVSISIPTAAPAQSGAEVFTATASMTAEGGAKTAPVKITIDRFATEAERAPVVNALRAGGNAAVKAALDKMPGLGTFEVAGHKFPIRYAYPRATSAGRVVTVVMAEPIKHLGADLPAAKPKAGYDLAVALLVLDASDTGVGEFAPAAQIKVNEAGAVVLSDYGADKVWLKSVAKAK